MPSTSANSHARSHSLLLLQKLLNLRDGASPLTLLLDSLEQTAQPLLTEFISRAQVRSFASVDHLMLSASLANAGYIDREE